MIMETSVEDDAEAAVVASLTDAIAELAFTDLVHSIAELGLTPPFLSAYAIQFQEVLFTSSSSTCSSIPSSSPSSSSSSTLPGRPSLHRQKHAASTHNLPPEIPPCIICLETPNKSGVFVPPQRLHRLCIPCLNKYVEGKLQAKQVTISCAETGCEETLTLGICGPFLTTALKDKWGVLLAEENIPEGQRVYCPFPDCSAVLVKDMDDEDMASVECPSCHRLFCVRCMVPWHADISCRRYQRLPPGERSREDVLLQGLAKDKKWRRCSHCKHFIELSQGCNHMTCRCGNQFCYKCGANWTSNNHTCKEACFKY